MSYHEHEGEPYIVIEKHSGGASNILLGVLIGAGVALLFAPRSGAETRAGLRRGARRAGETVRGAAQDVTDQVVDTFETARGRVEEQIEAARTAIALKKRQVSRAVEAGREAAHEARGDLERRLAETKAQYAAGADGSVAGQARTRTRIPVPADVDRSR